MEKTKLNLEKQIKKQKFKREKAKETLENVIQKIKIVNESPEYIYYISKAIVFGSYINTDKEYIGDLDIGLYFELKDKSKSEEYQNCQRCAKAGKSNLPFILKLIYGKEEIAKFIKDKKRIIDLHDVERAKKEAEYYNDPYCYIFADRYETIYKFEKEVI